MIKIFDHDSYVGKWETINIDVETELSKRFYDSYSMDKDNEFTHYIEVWNSETNEIIVHAAVEGSWLYNDHPDGPYFSRYYASLEQMNKGEDGWFVPTKLNPTKDYIIV